MKKFTLTSLTRAKKSVTVDLIAFIVLLAALNCGCCHSTSAMINKEGKEKLESILKTKIYSGSYFSNDNEGNKETIFHPDNELEAILKNNIRSGHYFSNDDEENKETISTDGNAEKATKAKQQASPSNYG